MNTIPIGITPSTNTTREKFMGGTIYPDQRTCKCGGRWKKETFRKMMYFTCVKCEAEPSLYVLRKYLPIPGGRGRQVPIRYDQSKRRLTTIAMAESTKEHINALIVSGKFDHTEFMGKEGRSLNRFSNFVEKRYLPFYEAKLKANKIKPSSMVSKKNLINNHILPVFGDLNIKTIDRSMVDEYYLNSSASQRMKDLAAQELKCILNYALETKAITSTFKFPPQKKAQLKDADRFLTYEEQLMVLDRIDNEQYKIMISILCYAPIRPSEVRALKWSDLDFRKGTMWIKRHVTIKSEIVPGRKSNNDLHSIPITEELVNILIPLPRPINQDAFIFPGHKGEIISEHCLSRAWKRAIELTKLPYVDLYRGTKSSRMSQMLRAGYSRTDIAAVAGVSENMVGRYAQHDDKSTRVIQLKTLTREG